MKLQILVSLFFLAFSPLGAFGADVKLPVPLLRQKYQFSCEAAALRMVLEFHGVKISEDEILGLMPKDPTPRKDGIWGDPDRGFVGDIHGKSGEESYGIHWRPMRTFAERWKKSVLIEHGSLRDLTKHLEQGRPLIAWIPHGTGKKMQWRTPSGKKIEAVEDEHTVVVRGFLGSPVKPEALYVLDPVDGARSVPREEFLKLWGSFHNSALAVYP